MTEFIKTSVGYLNTQHILMIRVGVEREAGNDLVQLSDGRTIHCVIYDRVFEPKPESAPAAAAPAAAETGVGRWPPDLGPRPKYDDDPAVSAKTDV